MSERTRIDRLIEDVLACAPGERDAFLDAACEGNAALRSEIASLLEQASRAQSFLEAPAAAPSLVGRTLGPYRIDAPIGAGGMGEVYRARDTKLGRDVAIKILPAFLAQDPDRLARLGREARTLAALNHPHIGSIYGIEEADGVRGLVLELVDGETLADRIAKGPLPISEALRIAGQIAEALAAAHAKGIVHRDLKPANIKITTSGSVKVLDFGLAKADAGESEGTTLATRVGTVMGTPAYMSPEQARGEAVDQQADIWAFGCVLYEMLTARRAFGGLTASDCIAAVLKAEPDWLPVPTATPLAVRTLLTRCLAKDRGRRLHSIADARFDLEGAFDRKAPATRTTRWPAWQKWSVAAALGLAIGLAGYLYGQSGEVATHVELDLPDATEPGAGIALSPDGKVVAASVRRGDATYLVVRYLDQLNGWQRLNGGEAGEYPFWSPDGKHLAFFVEGKLVRVDPPNGAPVVVCDVERGRGGIWLEDDTIVFGTFSGPLMRVDAKGGRVPVVFVPKEEGPTSLRFPVTAGPRRLLYLAFYTDGSRSELRVVDLDAPDRPTTVVKTTRNGIYDRGYLFYERNGIIIRQRFDPSTKQLQGEPVRVTGDASPLSGNLGYLPLAVGGGHVVVAMLPQPLNQLVWKARDGTKLDDIGDATDQQGFDLSPDGKRIAIPRRLPGQSERSIWIVDAISGASRRLTFGFGDTAPVWASDGERLAFVWTAGMSNKVNMVNVEGAPIVTTIAERHSFIVPIGWDANGRFVWSLPGSNIDDDLGKLGIFVSGGRAGSRESPVEFRVGLKVFGGRLSPDSRHVAYMSSKSGRMEVYVDTFPKPAGQPAQISKNGGRWPRWSRNSRELYFVDGTDLVVVAVSPGTMTPFGAPERLFALPVPSQYPVGAPSRYAVGPDGSRFLVLEQQTSPSSPLKLTLNWFSSLAARD